MKKRTLSLLLAFFLVAAIVANYPCISVQALVTQSWDWRNDGNTQGWTHNDQIDAWLVANGRYTLHIPNRNDPNITSPTMTLDTSVYKILEITYRNQTGNTAARLYWHQSGQGFSEANSQGFTTIADGKWHTLQINLAANSNWTGTQVQVRFDPTTGGSGNFELDSLRFLDGASRYSLSNGYFKISGVNGLIDTLCMDPTGTGNYSEDLLSGNMFLSFNMDGTGYSSTNTTVTSSISGTTLQLNNIQFASTGLVGTWNINLSGNQMRNTFTISSNANGKKIDTVGYIMDALWEKGGYEITASPAGSLKVPFSKMISSTNMYRSAYGYKRTSGEDENSFILDGKWIDWQGANGFNFNLRFYSDNEYLSPSCGVDEMRYAFRKPNSGAVVLNNGQSLIKTFTIELRSQVDITPASFPRFEGGDATVTKALNEIMYERNFGWRPAGTQPDWWEWMSISRDWMDNNLRDGEMLNTIRTRQDNNGYIWTWNELPGWPFPTDRDSKHYIITTANYINAVYNYFAYSGNLNYLKLNIDKLRLGMNYMLSLYDSGSNLFIITHSDHNGTNTSVGSNYWDITPYGYKSAYDNIYAYQALLRMASIEALLNNSTRASQLTTYANNLKTGFNNAFWSTNHYKQVIDSTGASHDYGCVYLNLEALTYGLADSTKSAAIMNYLRNTTTSSGSADALSAFGFAPRVTLFNNVNNANGGWYVYIYNSDGIFGTSQLQNGGANFYTAYYELMGRLKTAGANDAYSRLQTIVNRFNLDHLSGGNPLYNGEKNQHGAEGNVGLWGEFPESGIVPVIAKDGFMGISADLSGLHIKPNFPTNGMTSLSLNSMDYWGMKLKITASNTSVRIQCIENNSPYSDWSINGTAVSGLFDQTVAITSGGTVNLSRSVNTYDLNAVSLNNTSWIATIDNVGSISINGSGVQYGDHDWTSSHSGNYPLKYGKNVIAISGQNSDTATPASAIAEFTLPDGSKIITDSTWKASPYDAKGWNDVGFDDSSWSSATDYGAYGVSPWNTGASGFPTGSTAHWIWAGAASNTNAYLRKTFDFQMPAVSSSTSVENSDYGKAKVLDGVRTPRTGAKGWVSTTYTDANHTEWIQLDLGSSKKVNRVVLYPATNSSLKPDGFPVNFTIKTSTDGTNFNTVKTITGYNVNRSLEGQAFNFSDMNTRFVRVEATSLGATEAGGYNFRLAEFEIYNR